MDVHLGNVERNLANIETCAAEAAKAAAKLLVFPECAATVGRERGFSFIGKSKICDVYGNTLAFADHQDEEILYATVDLAEARTKRIERVPGKHAIDRVADRRPELYGKILTKPET